LPLFSSLLPQTQFSCHVSHPHPSSLSITDLNSGNGCGPSNF
jgi:hypothetical protein